MSNVTPTDTARALWLYWRDARIINEKLRLDSLYDQDIWSLCFLQESALNAARYWSEHPIGRAYCRLLAYMDMYKEMHDLDYRFEHSRGDRSSILA
jgi:hypothetical protein